jgi:hypothetical protein
MQLSLGKTTVRQFYPGRKYACISVIGSEPSVGFWQDFYITL